MEFTGKYNENTDENTMEIQEIQWKIRETHRRLS
jgi:hypothetical protein